MSGKRGRWERRLVAVLAVIGLAAAGVAYDRRDDVAGRSSLPLIGLICPAATSRTLSVFTLVS